jgi:WD40 repeat protein
MSAWDATNTTPVESTGDVTRPAGIAVVVALSSVGIGLWFGAGRHSEPDRRIVSIAVSSSGRWIAAGTHTGSIALLDLGNGSLQRISAGSGDLNDLQFSPDERFLAIANRNLSVASLGSLQRLRSDDRNYGTIRFSSDGGRLLTITGSGTIEVLDAKSGELQLQICCSTIYGETAFSPDGTMIVTAGHWPALWDARSGKLVRRLTGDREFETFRPIAFDPVRGWVVMGSQDGRVYAWDLRTGQRAATSKGHPAYVDSIAVLKDSPWIAYATLGGPVRLWNPDNGMERFPENMTATSNLIAGTRPHSILFGTAAGSVELWDTAAEIMLQRFDAR